MELIDTLRRCELTNGLNDTEIEGFLKIVHRRHAKKGETIFKEGDNSDELFIVSRGRVSVLIYSSSHQGEMELLTSLRDSDLFGEFSMIDGSARSATIVVEEEADLLFISYLDFHRYLQKNEHVGFIIMNNIAKILTSKLRKMNLEYRNAAL